MLPLCVLLTQSLVLSRVSLRYFLCVHVLFSAAVFVVCMQWDGEKSQWEKVEVEAYVF